VEAKTRITLDEFLAQPETKPYREFVDGDVVEKPMPGPSHAALVAELIFLLKGYVRATGVARVSTELRHADVDNEWVFLPDISVTRTGRRPPPADERGPVEVMPDFAIEVLSPDDQSGRITRRVSYYARAGVTLLWVVDPADESVTVFERGVTPRVARAPEELSAETVLPGFTLDLGRLFASLHE
jgi:Uma2 family endonuclease